MYLTEAQQKKIQKRAASSPPVYLIRERDWVLDLLLVGQASAYYCPGPYNVDQDPKSLSRWIPAYLLRETEEKHNNEDVTVKTNDIEERIKDKCDEMAN